MTARLPGGAERGIDMPGGWRYSNDQRMAEDKTHNPDHDEPGGEPRREPRDEPRQQSRQQSREDEPWPWPLGEEEPRGEYDEPLGELPRSVRQRLESLIPEMVKKTFAAGLGAVFTTEEGFRRLTKDLSLPKDMASYLASTAGTTKDEIIRIIAREVHDFLNTINLSEEVAKLLTTLSFEIKTEIRFIPNDEKYGGSVKPDVRANVRLRKNEDERPSPSSRRRRRRRRRRDEEGEGGDSGEPDHGDRITDADLEE